MKKVTILAFESTPLSALAFPIDIFNSAGTWWNKIFGESPNPQFEVKTVTLDGKPVRCNKSIIIEPDAPFYESPLPDLLIVSPVTDFKSLVFKDKFFLKTLKKYHGNGVHLASICTGSFILASTGLLDYKKATTHWGSGKLFSKRFPKVDLRIDQTVTDEQTLFCSGGANSGSDLVLYLIKKYCGAEIAYRTARTLVLDPARSSQAPYEVFNFDKGHGDIEIASAQQWLEQNYQRSVMVESMASEVALSRRTFERRFKKATGESPIKYLQRIRIESAKLHLESSNEPFEQITFNVGYEDPSTFRKIFQKNTGLSPGSYRDKFKIK
ncbi:MAG: helix-turn-helix domain-containing protein [Deltaproteobacteria bacterium]|nr:helix-turn-helix domain-containing protein [Deltaproteobacteria bacterium]